MIKTGDTIKVFDPREWFKQGKDIGHNENCYKYAIVEDIRYNTLTDYGFYPVLYDVIFIHDGFHSHGHFPEAIQ